MTILRWAAVLALGALSSGCGAKNSCESAECVRAFTCRSACGQPVVYSGCCACPAGTFDDLGRCLADGGVVDAGG